MKTTIAAILLFGLAFWLHGQNVEKTAQITVGINSPAVLASGANSTIHFGPTAPAVLSIPFSGESLTISSVNGTLSVSLKDGSVKTTGEITAQGAAEAFWKAVGSAFPADYLTRRRITQLEGAMALNAMRAGYASMQALFNIEMIHARSPLTKEEDRKQFSEAMGKLLLRMTEVENQITRMEEELGLKPGEDFKLSP